VVATRNADKMRELEELLPDSDLEPLPDEIVLPPEEGLTFAANALVKARTAQMGTGIGSIADDSGIEATALDGAPGIYSARYAGDGASDEQNLAKLLAELKAAGDDRRVAYVCVLAYVNRVGEEGTFEARCSGTLIEEPRGSGGFGYDPAFVPDEIEGDRTMAELSPEEKNRISHRGKAVRLFAAHLRVAAQANAELRGDLGQ
jgi:XTP/dITP diphosphohydrolase